MGSGTEGACGSGTFPGAKGLIVGGISTVRVLSVNIYTLTRGVKQCIVQKTILLAHYHDKNREKIFFESDDAVWLKNAIFAKTTKTRKAYYFLLVDPLSDKM